MQEFGLLVRDLLAVGREQDDAARAQAFERVADGSRGRRHQPRARLPQSGDELGFAGCTFRGRIGGAMKRNHVAARVCEHRRRLHQARHESLDGDPMNTGHAQPRHVGDNAGWQVPHHLAFHHPVGRRDDQSDACGHAAFSGCGPTTVVWIA